jgi:GDP-L-fucose synthase
MSSFWRDKKALVTGGAGFVGSYVVEQLLDRGASVTVADKIASGIPPNLAAVAPHIQLKQADLADLEQAKDCCRNQDVVINMAARTGGVGFNTAHPGTVFHDNVILNTNMLEAARVAETERFLVVSSACVYPVEASVPTPESEGFNGDPEPANFGYGWAKRLAEIQARTYAEEFGMKIAIVRPYNAYGPRAQFDPAVSHVVAALIKRVFDGENPVLVWGDGEQERAFLYAGDFARGLLETVEKYAVCDPVNIGTDEETKIKDLVKMIIQLTGKDVAPYFDTTKPGGSPRRNCDTTKAKEKVGFVAKVGLAEGLKETIDWYRRDIKKEMA